MKRIYKIFNILMAVVAVASCNVDSMDNPSAKKGLSFNVVFENEVGSKSGDLELRSENGEIPLVLQRIPDTKSVQINNEGTFRTVYNGNFEVEGNDGGSKVFHADAIYNSGTGLWDLQNSSYVWKPGHTLEVVAVAADFNTSEFFDGITYNGNPSTTNFYYSLPETPSQKDFLVGYYKGEANTGTVSLTFNHPLTSVQFIVGDMPEGVSLTVNSISLEGLDKTARCIASFASPTTYVWNNYSGTVDYSKAFDAAQPMTPGSALVDGDDTFIVIPRKFPHNTDAKIVVNVTEYNRTYNVYASLADQEWKPGETNVYAISYEGARQAVLTNGDDVNSAMRTLARNLANIKHVRFEVGSDITSETEVQAATQWPIYMTWDASTQTIIISTSDTQISSGASLDNLFNGLTALESIENLHLLNTRRAVSMFNLFRNCSSLTEIDLSNFTTENVTNIAAMFYGASSLTTLDLSSFVTDNIISTGQLFCLATNLTSVNFGDHFQLPKNTSFSYWFYHTKITTADLHFITSDNVNDFEDMFSGCTQLVSVDLSGLGANDNCLLAQNMFSGSTAIKSINFGPNLNLQRLPLSGTRNFFPTSLTGPGNLVITCSETFAEKLKTYGGFSSIRNRVTFVVAE